MSSDPRSLKIVYFAWVRERVGKSEELVAVPTDVTTISDLIGWLTTRGDEYANAFAEAHVIRAAIDHTHAPHTTAIGDASEIAFFPPVTGG